MMWLGITIALVLAVMGSLKLQRRWKSQQRRSEREAMERLIDAEERQLDRAVADADSTSTTASSKVAPETETQTETTSEAPHWTPIARPLTSTTEPPEEKQQRLVAEYQYLRELLDEHRYEEADRVTWRIFLQLVNEEKRGYPDIDELDVLPVEALRNLDRCWHDATGGQWSFSRQAQMFRNQNCNYSELGKETGWMIDGLWLDPARAIYDPDRAPDGHLPQELWRNLLGMFGSMGLAICVETFLMNPAFQSEDDAGPENSTPSPSLEPEPIAIDDKPASAYESNA